MKTLPLFTEGSSVHHPENFVGKFTVIHKSGISKFDILDLAVKYFQKLKAPAAMWDVTIDEKLIASKIGQ